MLARYTFAVKLNLSVNELYSFLIEILLHDIREGRIPCRFRYLKTSDRRLRAADGVCGHFASLALSQSEHATNPHLTYKKFLARW